MSNLKSNTKKGTGNKKGTKTSTLHGVDVSKIDGILLGAGWVRFDIGSLTISVDGKYAQYHEGQQCFSTPANVILSVHFEDLSLPQAASAPTNDEMTTTDAMQRLRELLQKGPQGLAGSGVDSEGPESDGSAPQDDALSTADADSDDAEEDADAPSPAA